MDPQGIDATCSDLAAESCCDKEARRQREDALSDAATRHSAALLRRANEWDEWKSVRDVA